MSWKRLGLVYAPDGSRPWARTHAALPTPVEMQADVFRFFFSARDAAQKSHVGWVDIDLSAEPRVLREAQEPALSPGEKGTFDDSGVSIGSIAKAGDDTLLFYMGWKLGTEPPWQNAIGVARARNGLQHFDRFLPDALLSRSDEDPHTLSYPCVFEYGLDDWRMWYGSNLNADLSSDGMRHVIKAARSRDGVHWERDGTTLLGFADPTEHVLSRPTVTRLGERLLMCFACRGKQYRIGAAWSEDGVRWRRIDESMGLEATESWEQGVTCYPALFSQQGRLWLAYNGSGFGAKGFGLAVWTGGDPSTNFR